MQEFGGFSNKRVLSAYNQQNRRVAEARKKPFSIAPPNEEFVKAQKQKLRELMLHNAALGNRRSVKLTLAKRALDKPSSETGEPVKDSRGQQHEVAVTKGASDNAIKIFTPNGEDLFKDEPGQTLNQESTQQELDASTVATHQRGKTGAPLE